MHADEPLADEDREESSRARIQQHRDRELPRNRKKHPGEGEQGHRRVDQGEQIAEDSGSERPDILRDALVGVVHTLRVPEAVIRAVEKEPAHQDLGQPEPPQQRQPLGAIPVKNTNGNRDREGPEINPHVAVKSGGVPLGERVDEIPARVAHQHLHKADRRAEDQQEHDKHPRLVAGPIQEKRLRELREPLQDQQAADPVVGGFFSHIGAVLLGLDRKFFPGMKRGAAAEETPQQSGPVRFGRIRSVWPWRDFARRVLPAVTSWNVMQKPAGLRTTTQK